MEISALWKHGKEVLLEDPMENLEEAKKKARSLVDHRSVTTGSHESGGNFTTDLVSGQRPGLGGPGGRIALNFATHKIRGRNSLSEGGGRREKETTKCPKVSPGNREFEGEEKKTVLSRQLGPVSDCLTKGNKKGGPGGVNEGGLWQKAGREGDSAGTIPGPEEINREAAVWGKSRLGEGKKRKEERDVVID